MDQNKQNQNINLETPVTFAANDNGLRKFIAGVMPLRFATMLIGNGIAKIQLLVQAITPQIGAGFKVAMDVMADAVAYFEKGDGNIALITVEGHPNENSRSTLDAVAQALFVAPTATQIPFAHDPTRTLTSFLVTGSNQNQNVQPVLLRNGTPTAAFLFKEGSTQMVGAVVHNERGETLLLKTRTDLAIRGRGQQWDVVTTVSAKLGFPSLPFGKNGQRLFVSSDGKYHLFSSQGFEKMGSGVSSAIQTIARGDANTMFAIAKKGNEISVAVVGTPIEISSRVNQAVSTNENQSGRNGQQNQR